MAKAQLIVGREALERLIGAIAYTDPKAPSVVVTLQDNMLTMRAENSAGTVGGALTITGEMR